MSYDRLARIFRQPFSAVHNLAASEGLVRPFAGMLVRSRARERQDAATRSSVTYVFSLSRAATVADAPLAAAVCHPAR